MNSNAYDYLQEYAKDKKCNPWISKVIKAFVSESGKMSDNSKELLVADLLGEKEYILDSLIPINSSIVENTVTIGKLEHISGVNALANNQSIRFCADVNVIYGLNGTGKSSYFRILNEVVGGSKQKKIIGNIYSENNDEILSKIEYKINGNNKQLEWDNSNRGIDDFATVRVFDSAYTEGLLKKRDSDNLLVKPYGLNAFAEIISAIDDMLNMAKSELDKKEISIPGIDKTELSDDTKKLFEKERYETEDIDKLKILGNFDDKLEKRLETITNEISVLNQVNINDKIQIESEHKEKVQKLRNKIISISANFELLSKNVHELIINYENRKDAAEQSKKQYEILSQLPGIKTSSWKNFIVSAQKYINENEMSANECPYCHRPYDDNSLKIVREYADFLADENEILLQNCINSLNSKKSEINNLEILSDDDYQLEYISDATKKDIKEFNDCIEKKCRKLVEIIDTKKQEPVLEVDISIIDSQLTKIINEYDSSIVKFSADDSDKKKKIECLSQEKIKLCEKKSIKEQYSVIEEYIQSKNTLFDLKKLVGAISTTKISSMSKKAHNELLTVNLQQKFQELLLSLNVKNISIELKGQNNKGIQQTELVINSYKNVDNILSEGEQKATALALFLAEIVLSENKSTLIFDDPVNSMDHRMMAAFANQLLKLDNQIIVFTHNKMFLDSFSTSDFGHFCKTYSSACSKVKGKHILVYETQAEGKNRKGVIVEKTIENANYYLNAVEQLLKETPFVKKEEACMKLRKAVELLIDERIFNRQVPTKYSTKASRIAWDELKNLCNDSSIIDSLKLVHNRASGGELHNGVEREENPIDKEEIQEMYDILKSI